MTGLKTLTERDILNYAAWYLNDQVADFQDQMKKGLLDPEEGDALIEDIDRQLEEIYDAQEALEKEEERA